MNSLGKTIESGFRAVELFLGDSDPEALHGRTDFYSLRADLTFPSEPFAAEK